MLCHDSPHYLTLHHTTVLTSITALCLLSAYSNEFEYQLTLRTDLYTSRHTQWYYFQVNHMQAGMPYRFTIVNFTKHNSLYKCGLWPLLYSEANAKKHKVGWRRTGDEIKYYKNNAGQGRRQYFSLTWTFPFPHDQDTCYFAHCYPYTYSNLQEYLVAISKDPVKSKFCKIHILCHSLAGNTVCVLTITSPPRSGKGTKKKAVILTARVHLGETNSSWIMKGFLDYILGNSDRQSSTPAGQFCLQSGTHVESRWCDCGKSPLLFNWSGPELQIWI